MECVLLVVAQAVVVIGALAVLILVAFEVADAALDEHERRMQQDTELAALMREALAGRATTEAEKAE